jgi:Transglycosylase SLT domain
MDDKLKIYAGLAVAAVAVIAGSRAVAAPSTAAPGTPAAPRPDGSPTPPGSSTPAPTPANPCDLSAFKYSPPLFGFPKSQVEAERRIKEHIRDTIGGVMFDDFKRAGVNIVTAGDAENVLNRMATLFYSSCAATGMPLDLVLAIAWRESSFRLSTINDANAQLRAGKAVGLMQIRRLAAIDAGYPPEGIGSGGAYWAVTLSQTTWAGVKYLAVCRNRYRKPGDGHSWADVVMCFTEGPTGSKTPDRCALKRKYLADVLAKARDYSDLHKL